MKGYLIISLVLLSQLSFAQRLRDDSWMSNAGKSFATIWGDVSTASSGLHNDLLLESITKDFLSTETRSAQLNGLDSPIRFGGDYSYGLGAGIALNPRTQLSLWLSDEAHAHALIAPDMLKLIFQGNKQFAGDTAFLRNSAVNLTRFQKLGIGWSTELSTSSVIGVRASIINAETLFDLETDNSFLYTSELGDSLYADLDGSLLFSDSGNVGFARNNGGGFALDVYYSQRLGFEGDKWQLDFRVDNLGMVTWNYRSTSAVFDKELSFSGVDIGDASQIENANLDVLDSLQAEIESELGGGSATTMLPGGLQVSMKQEKDQGIEMAAGGVYRWNSRFQPFGWIGASYQVNEFFEGGMNLGYGGYGGAQIGLEAKYSSERLDAGLRIANLDALVALGSRGGAGAGILISYRW